MKIVVTGATGYIGSHLVEALLAANHNVHVIARSFPGLLRAKDIIHPNLSCHKADISDINQILPIFASADVVYHLACSSLPHSSNNSPIDDVSININGSLNVLESSRLASIKKFIFVSSGGTVYGLPSVVPIPESHGTNPLCSYGITKLAIEKYVALYQHLYGLKGLILRVANPYGGRQNIESSHGVIPNFLNRALLRQPLYIIGDGSIIRDFVHISDLVSALIASCSYSGYENIFNIGSGVGLSILELVEKLELLLGRNLHVNFQEGRSCDVSTNVLSVTKAKSHLRWVPQISIENGLLQYYKELTKTIY